MNDAVETQPTTLDSLLAEIMLAWQHATPQEREHVELLTAIHVANAEKLWDLPSTTTPDELRAQAKATYRMYRENQIAGEDEGISGYIACLPPKMAVEYSTAKYITDVATPKPVVKESNPELVLA